MKELLARILKGGTYNKGGVYTVTPKLTNKPAPIPKESINIYDSTNENAHLSNFAKRPFVFDSITYNTVEGAFQAKKLDYSPVFNPIDREGFSTGSPTEAYFRKQQEFAKATGPSAKQLGKRQNLPGLNTVNWDKDSEGLMKILLRDSFKQNPTELQRLLDTGNSILTHTQDKSKWGKLFPQILMEVREELKNEQSSLQSAPEITTVSQISDRLTEEEKSEIKECSK